MELNQRIRSAAAALSVIAAAVLPGAAVAGTVFESPDFQVDVNNYQYGSEMLNVQLDDETSTFSARGFVGEEDLGFGWNLGIDPDPLIGGAVSVINQTDDTKNFSVLFDLDVNAPFAPGLQRGEVSYMVTDTGGLGEAPGDGQAAVSNLQWWGLIDGVRSLNLALVDASCFGPGCSVSIGPIAEAFSLYELGVTSSIGIELTFDLTAGDQLDIRTLFEVIPTTPVPLPAGLVLLLSGLAVFAPLRARQWMRRNTSFERSLSRPA